jgi:hypothetical protein
LLRGPDCENAANQQCLNNGRAGEIDLTSFDVTQGQELSILVGGFDVDDEGAYVLAIELRPYRPNLTCPQFTDALVVGSFRNHCYATFGIDMPWAAAVRQCAELGGHLAVPNTDDESVFIGSIRENNVEPWIGISDLGNEGDFKAITSEPLVSRFAAFEPNNRGLEGEHCLHVDGAQGADRVAVAQRERHAEVRADAALHRRDVGDARILRRVLDGEHVSGRRDVLADRLRERRLARRRPRLADADAGLDELPVFVDEGDERGRRAEQRRREARDPIERLLWR